MWYYRKHTIVSIPGLLLVLLSIAHLIGFLSYIGVSVKRGRIVKDNDVLPLWVCLIGLLIDLQGLFVISAYRSSNRYLYWTEGWMAYGGIAVVFALCIVGGYGTVGTTGAAVWGATWTVGAILVVYFAARARRGYAVDRIMGIPEFRPRLAESRGVVLMNVVLDNAFPWASWLVCAFFGLLLVIQALALANDHRRYSVPGTLVPVQTNGGEDWYNLHVWCVGRDKAQHRPVFVMLPEFGMPSTSMIGLARGVADQGHAACIVDRPGYGWSEPGFWRQDPVDVVRSIAQALDKYPIHDPLILVGWGEGGVWAQLFMQVADYSNVVGVVLLDTLPNQEILQTFALNRTTTLQNLRHMRSATTTTRATTRAVHFDPDLETSASRRFAAWRAVSPLALHRERNTRWDGFQPQDALAMHRATFRNNLYYQAKYFEYDGTGSNLYQALLPYVKSNTAAVLVYHHWPLRWPAFLAPKKGARSVTRRAGSPPAEPASSSDLPVVIIASGRQFDSDCESQGIDSKEECTKWQAVSWFYYRQQIEYQQTLSQNAAFLVCTKPVSEDNKMCDTDFVWTRPTWLSRVIVTQFYGQSSNTTK